MTNTLHTPGPVSAALDAELREVVRKQGVVFLLDKEGAYSGFVDRLLAQGWTYPVCAWRGSFLQLMVDLDDHAASVDRTPVLVHLPGFNADDVKVSPLFELYSAGVRHQKALETLITEAAAGRVRPEQIAAFKGDGPQSLQGADAWLSAQLRAVGDGIAAQLTAMTTEALVDDLLGGGFISGRLHSAVEVDQLWHHFGRTLGLADAWRDEGTAQTTRAKDVAFTVCSWAMVVEYVHDLQTPPTHEQLVQIAALPTTVAAACSALAVHLRARHAAFYTRTAMETETRVDGSMQAQHLGRIDTFLFEERAILEAAVTGLQAESWDTVIDWARPRAAALSFWTRQEPQRQNAWQLVLDAACLGKAIVDAGSAGDVKSLDAAVDRYVARGAAVDRAHRTLEQRRIAVLYPQVPYFELLRARLDEMRGRWRTWADSQARAFNKTCCEHGFLPSPELQQRTLFDQVVRPLTVDSAGSNDATALFMVDALRFEMAQELFDAIGDVPSTHKHLKARLAELPTVTEVGMNVLAPVVDNGRLKPAFSGDGIKGFGAGEFRVFNPETRRRAMFDRVGGKGCPLLTLEEVLAKDASALRKTVEQARLLVVHSQEIDNAGEKGVGASVFDKVLQDLRAAWRLLREAGVKRFVITADHGFLLLDDRTGDAKAHGRKIDPKRRHVFSDVAADHSGEVRVALKDLGYDGVSGHVMFPDGVGTFDIGGRGQNFVHGGNSLQERVIPVLTLVHKQPAGSDTHAYSVVATAIDGVGGMHGIEGRVVLDHTSLFGGKKTIELGLRVVDDTGAVGGVVVELAQTRQGARLAGSVIHADVGAVFEVYFRLLGSTDARVRVVLVHTGGDAVVADAVVDGRFTVTPLNTLASGPVPKAPAATTTTTTTTTWLQDLPAAGGIRQVFEHLAAHGAVTETEASAMLGGPREARRFSNHFELYAAKAPFRVRIDFAGGIKRYVREGSDG